MYSRRSMLIGSGAALAMSLAAGCRRGPSEEIFTVGGVLPLTGDGASFGDAAAKGANLAVDLFNRRHAATSQRAAWIAEDSRGEPAAAASATRKLLDVNGARALVGDVTSAATHAIVPIANAARTPLISPAASDPALSGASPFFARVWPSDIFEARIIAGYAKDQGYRRIAAVYTNDDYGVGFFNAFQRIVGEALIVVNTPFPANVSDFRTPIQRIRAGNPDAILLVSLPERARLFITQATEAGVDLPILATGSIEDPQIARLRGANRVVFASPAPVAASSAARREFETEFRRAYRQDPGVLADTGYDAARLLLEAHQANSDPVRMMEWIKTRRNYDGASGQLSFDSSGDVVKPYRLKRGQAGGFVFV